MLIGNKIILCTALTDLAQHTLLHAQVVEEDLRIELVQTGVHHLHTDPDIALPIHGAIEVNRIGAVAGTHRYVQVHDEAMLFPYIHRHGYALDGQNCVRLPMSHLLNDAIGATSQIADLLQAVGLNVEGLLANLNGCPGIQVTRRYTEKNQGYDYVSTFHKLLAGFFLYIILLIYICLITWFVPVLWKWKWAWVADVSTWRRRRRR